MDKYIIVDNFFTVGLGERLDNLTFSPDLQYRLYPSHNGEYNKEKYISSQQFSYHIYINDTEKEYVCPNFKDFTPFFLPLKEYFGNYTLVRAKINISCIQLSGKLQPPHFDLVAPDPENPSHSVPVPHWVFLYYINDSDGDTVLFKNENEILTTIPPKKNRAVLFDGTTLHAASTPQNYPYRAVLNVDLIPTRIPTQIPTPIPTQTFTQTQIGKNFNI